MYSWTYNYNRKIVGFDTFKGFPNVDEIDGKSVKKGHFSVSKDYEILLQDIMDLHQKMSPITHIIKFDLKKGDVIRKFQNISKETRKQ